MGNQSLKVTTRFENLDLLHKLEPTEHLQAVTETPWQAVPKGEEAYTLRKTVENGLFSDCKPTWA